MASFTSLLLSFSLLFSSCGEKQEAVLSVSVNPPSLEMTVGQSASLSASVSPSGASAQVSWSSSSTAVATVSGGTVKAVGEGTATITATAEGKSGTCNIRVKSATVFPSGITLDNPSLTLDVGESRTLKAEVSPADATDKSVSWLSSDPKVASVVDGTVKALSEGTATVTAATVNNLKATCTVTVNKSAVPASVFAKGADVSWVTEMERDKVVFHDKGGKEEDLFKVLASLGMNAVRLRVFVQGDEGWCSRDDVAAKAVRAAAAGLEVMVDFHYSDFFADPGRQTVPSSWKGLDADALAAKVEEHTVDVLSALREAGVTPMWIQIGNETRNGMLWDVARFWNDKDDISGGRENFVKIFNRAYDAAKSVFPSASVMPHLNNAYQDNAWWFRDLKALGLKFDMIALSHYPMADDPSKYASVNGEAVKNISALASAFGVPVIISEVGVRLSVWDGSKMADNTAAAVDCMESFMGEIRKISACRGIFYWEPEVYGGWKPSVYKDVSKYVPGAKPGTSWNAYEMGAFTSQGTPSPALDCFKD